MVNSAEAATAGDSAAPLNVPTRLWLTTEAATGRRMRIAVSRKLIYDDPFVHRLLEANEEMSDGVEGYPLSSSNFVSGEGSHFASA